MAAAGMKQAPCPDSSRQDAYRASNGSLQVERPSINVQEEETLPMSSEQSKDTVDVDAGSRWRFMIVLGSFIVHLLLGGINRCYGVIYIRLRHRYNSTAALTASVGGMSTAMRMGAAPLSTAMSECLGNRLTVILGGLMFGLSVSATAFVPNTETAMVTLGILSGIGGALIYIPSLVMVAQYFIESRATALGVATSGSGIGVFILPLLMDALFEHYEYQGGMVLIGGLLLNTVVAGCLYRPLPNRRTADPESQTNSQKQGDAPITSDHVEIQKLDLNDQTSKIKPQWKSPFRMLVRRLHMTLLKDMPFLSFFFAQIFVSASYWPAQMLLPDLARSCDHSAPSSVLLLSLLGITDVVGRVGGGAIFDIRWVKTHQRLGYSLLLLTTTLTVLAWPFAGSSYPLLAVGVVVHGLAAGALVSMKGVIAASLVGTKMMGGGLGLAVFAQGIGVMTAPPIAGLLRDITANYTWSFTFLGVLGLLGTVIFYVGATPKTCFSSRKSNLSMRENA